MKLSAQLAAVWEKVAARQSQQRQQSEVENAKLKDMLEEQIRVARALEKLLRKRASGNLLSRNKNKKFKWHRVVTQEEQNTIFRDLLRQLEDLFDPYAALDATRQVPITASSAPAVATSTVRPASEFSVAGANKSIANANKLDSNDYLFTNDRNKDGDNDDEDGNVVRIRPFPRRVAPLQTPSQCPQCRIRLVTCRPRKRPSKRVQPERRAHLPAQPCERAGGATRATAEEEPRGAAVARALHSQRGVLCVFLRFFYDLWKQITSREAVGATRGRVGEGGSAAVGAAPAVGGGERHAQRDAGGADPRRARAREGAAEARQRQRLRRGGSPGHSANPSDPTNPTSATSTKSQTSTSSNELFAATPGTKLSVEERWKRLGNLGEYECVAWRPCKDCSPTGAVETNQSLPCNASIANGVAGFCEIRHKTTQLTQRVMEMHCDSLRPGVAFKCEDFATILSYGKQATTYVLNKGFSYDQCRTNFETDQAKANKAPLPLEVKAQATRDAFFQRGLAIVVYEKLLESVFASIKSMRQLGCSLPIELWYMTSETDTNHPLLRVLTSEYGVYLREITDARATRFYTKIYAVYYSAFDQVLLLDADNFAVRDPTYLFASTEFQATGALFWPDFWRFKKTIFNIQPTSFVWDVLDLDPVDMFEQESGQVLVDRRRHLPAMNAMMYYAFHPALLEKIRLVWGDKDLFRFAWMKTKSAFHMIAMPPGSAGVKLPDRNEFCGVTMVQHDTKGDVVFLHRNQEKLTSDNRRIVWQHLQQFKLGEVPLDDYDVRGANGGRYYPMFKRCYGKDIYYERAFNVQPVAQTSFAGLEVRLLDFIQEAARIAKPAKNATATPTVTPSI